MILRKLYILTALLFSLAGYGQSTTVSFDKIIANFKSISRDPFAVFSGRLNDSASVSSLYKTKYFNVSISENPIPFDTVHLIINNPYYTDDFDDYDDNYINYPVSFSVIHDERLISLFRNGKFVCHKIDDMKRDLDLEKKLNTRRFKYHWIIDDQLAAMSGSIIYVWNGTKWKTLKTTFPLTKQPKLFEDNEFIVFKDCKGEFGGTIYFFEKKTGDIYFTESTCANTVLKKDGKYAVLANLGHSSGFSEIKLVENPRNLTKAKKNEINNTKTLQAIGYADKSGAYKKTLYFYGAQILSGFQVNDRQLYLVYLHDQTFLAEIHGNDIEIVHPFFDKKIYTHDPITTTYGSRILINLDFYRTALYREVSVLIIEQGKITKVDWNEDQSN